MDGHGWIKLHRKIMNSDTFECLNAIQKLIAIYIILNANHEDGVWHDKYKNVSVPIKRGQLVTSRNTIVNEWFGGDKEVTEQKVRTTLKKLEKIGFLTIEPTKYYTLLTVCNYGVYQQKENDVNQVINHDLTNNQPSLNQEITTNKNDKNDKNDKNSEEAASPTISDREVFDFYQQNLQAGITESPFILEKISHWIDDLSPEVVLEAMKEQAVRELKGFAYTEKVLKNWADRKITSLDAIKRMKDEHERKGSTSSFRGRTSKRKEPVPTWLAQEPESPQEPSEGEIDQERERLQKKLKEYRAAQN